MIQFPQKDKKAFSNQLKSPVIVLTMLWTRSDRTGNLLVADAENLLKDNTASEVYVKKFRKKEVGIWRFEKSCRRRSEFSPLQHESISFKVEWKISVDIFLAKTLMDQTFQKAQKHAMESKHEIWSISGGFIHRHHVMNRENYVCLEKIILVFHFITLMLSDTLKWIWTFHKSTQLTIIGMSSVNDHFLDRGLDSQDLQFWRTSIPEGQMWSGNRLTKIRTTSQLDEIWPDIWSKMSKHSQREARRQWSTEKPSRWPPIERNLLHDFR